VTLAALRVIEVPARMSEAAIAFSIAITAADNLWPFLGTRRGVIAFGFGLIHGLGFASALGPLALRGWPLIAALAGFNLGIEVVQLTLALIAFAIVFVVARPGFAMPRLPARALLPLASLVIFGFSAYWFVDRSFLLVTLP
jgi:HupE / UreJ protein